MAKKSIIEIDVKDEKFRAFYELFDKYNEELAKSPEKMETWNKVIAAGMAAVVDNTHGIAKALHNATKAQHQFQQATHKSGKVLASMRKDAGRLAKDLFGVGKFLVKGGLLGIGSIGAGIFGLDRVATDAIQTQRTARGLGLNTGQLRAWKINFDRFVNPSTLNAIAAEKGSTQGVAMLSAASGLSPTAVSTMGTAALDYRIMMRLKEMSKSWNPAAYQQMLQAYGFTNAGFTIEDMRRLQSTRTGTLESARAAYERNKILDRTGMAPVHALWLFQRELEQTGKMLGTDIQKRLSVLGPTLGSFVKSLGGDAKILINEVLSRGNLDAMKDGISSFAKYLASGQAKASIIKFTSALGELGSAVEYLAGKIHPIKSYASSFEWELHHRAVQLGGLAFSGSQFLKKHPIESPSRFLSNTYHDALRLGDFATAMPGGYTTPYRYLSGAYKAAGRFGSLFENASKATGISPTLLHALAAVESAGNPNATSRVGAKGLFQFMPSTAKALGIDPNSPGSSTIGAAWYLRNLSFDLLKHNPAMSGLENLKATIASYNWGIGNVEKDMRKHGAHWLQYAPSETRGEVDKVLSLLYRHMQKPARVSLNIFNAASARVAVSANAASPR